MTHFVIKRGLAFYAPDADPPWTLLAEYAAKFATLADARLAATKHRGARAVRVGDGSWSRRRGKQRATATRAVTKAVGESER